MGWSSVRKVHGLPRSNQVRSDHGADEVRHVDAFTSKHSRLDETLGVTTRTLLGKPRPSRLPERLSSPIDREMIMSSAKPRDQSIGPQRRSAVSAYAASCRKIAKVDEHCRLKGIVCAYASTYPYTSAQEGSRDSFQPPIQLASYPEVANCTSSLRQCRE